MIVDASGIGNILQNRSTSAATSDAGIPGCSSNASGVSFATDCIGRWSMTWNPRRCASWAMSTECSGSATNGNSQGIAKRRWLRRRRGRCQDRDNDGEARVCSIFHRIAAPEPDPLVARSYEFRFRPSARLHVELKLKQISSLHRRILVE